MTTTPTIPADSVGIVEEKTFTFAEDEPFRLQSGATLAPVTLTYETYGTLKRKAPTPFWSVMR